MHTQQLEIDYQYYRLCSLLELWGSIYFQETSTRLILHERSTTTRKEVMVSSYVPGAESRKPYNWTAGDLMSGLEEFLGDAFRIAHILDGTPF